MLRWLEVDPSTAARERSDILVSDLFRPHYQEDNRCFKNLKRYCAEYVTRIQVCLQQKMNLFGRATGAEPYIQCREGFPLNPRVRDYMHKGKLQMKLEDLKEGDVVEVDDGFNCMPMGGNRIVHIDDKIGPFIYCTPDENDDGVCQMKPEQHRLAGQITSDGELSGIRWPTDH